MQRPTEVDLPAPAPELVEVAPSLRAWLEDWLASPSASERWAQIRADAMRDLPAVEHRPWTPEERRQWGLDS